MFQTYWTIAGERFDDWTTVERLVIAGAIAEEIPAEHQEAEHEARQEADRLHREQQAKLERFALQNDYDRSAQGRREAALREAARHGSRVTVVTADDAYAELDAFGRHNTNALL